MISAEQQRAKHREKEYPQPDRDVARPHKTSGDYWRCEYNDVNKDGLLGWEPDGEPRMGVTVPQRRSEVNNDESADHYSGHEAARSECVFVVGAIDDARR